MLKEFKDFLLRGNIVDLAVAVIIGAAFGAVVTSLVENMFTPLIGIVAGQADFSKSTFEIGGTVFKYGLFVNSLIAFVSIAAVVFFAVVKPMNALQSRLNKGGDEEEEEVAEDIALLTEIRDALKARS